MADANEIPEALLPFLNEARNTFGRLSITFMASGDYRFVGNGDFYCNAGVVVSGSEHINHSGKDGRGAELPSDD